MDEVAQSDNLLRVHEFRLNHQVVDVSIQDLDKQVQVLFLGHAGVSHLKRFAKDIHYFVSMLLEVAVV